MKTILYSQSKNKLMLRLFPVKGRPKIKLGRFELWWDKEGKICALAINSFKEVLEKFRESRQKRPRVKLGGVWKGIIKIDKKDIKEVRKELLKKLEERWEKW